VKTIVAASEKGGVGKTTLAAHLAWFFAENRRVLAIDLDQQGNLTSALEGYRSHIAAIDLFTTSEHGPIAYEAPAEPGITLASATRELLDVEKQAPAEVLGAFFAAIQANADGFDVCVIDTPPRIHLLLLSALMASDAVISPVELSDWSYEGVQNLFKALAFVNDAGRDPDFLGLLVSRYRGRPQAKKREKLFETLGKVVFPGQITTRTAYERIATEKVPVWQMKGSGGREASAEIREVLSEIEMRMGLGE
jgi:chromosome partitioning protein